MTNGQTHATNVDLGDPRLSERVNAGMAAVEQLLQSEIDRGQDFLKEKVSHLSAAGGKRFRPMMALLASEYGSHPQGSRVIKAATVVEMVHVATLYHDDVMDEADRRRGVESANSRWSNSVAILAGDALLAHASRLMSQLDTHTVAHFADTFEELVTGQMRETIGVGEANPIDHYTAVIREKTAVLIASAGYLGAYHSGASPEHAAALRQIGGAVGMIFQIVDDIIDIFGDPRHSGKTPGTDLREGVFTLPVLYALEEEGAVGDGLRELLTGSLDTDDDVERAIELLRQSGGRDKAMADVHAYLRVVEEQLSVLPEIPASQALRQLADFTVSRVG
ncbi:polyprenyl synthetase family protein [Corynebacterium flavescens]|uniref:Geranylgeranyl pyrophosphate synthase n=1 Tax=Corynebacterium flavescens TaxID=28028 RepID=A0A1L7CJV8_CORFL|nr:polyprenyl synthetase family protein [Corynebacterium flavescens]APT86078.1 geranylgeranyl pyrophosphate synthase [Corynebacterium flavescens]KAA8724746.1 polyprenyl synthetase family protein [Corynebacterium flavescens]MDN6099198.1 polyprenyl synthetase family protein [Corynebacterium flavescens]MDN6199704.1 polyprenyl synthetase family protein [Corynebacterium flavescens]MDN6226623.1 polyprenyl synthetase family protein [Corynebacterium flavescens]